MPSFPKIFFSALLCIVIFSACSSLKIKARKGIIYDAASRQKLDLYSPKAAGRHEILVFIHGGNWRSGNRKMYSFLGKRMAAKGILCAVIDYRLSAVQNYEGMAADAANAVKWICENSEKFGGNRDSLFLAGHSAGGHLAALISLNKKFFDAIQMKNPVKGVLLVDPFGLDMEHYLSTATGTYKNIYEPAFSKDTLTWHAASPIHYLTAKAPPFIMLVGAETFDAIKEDCRRFYDALAPYRPQTRLLKVENKGHFKMIGMFHWSRNKYYNELLGFMRNPQK